MDSEASIQRGKGLIANPEFFLSFILAAALGIAGALSIITSWLEFDEHSVFEGVRLWAVLLMAVVGALMAVAAFTKLADKLFIVLLAVLGLIAGVVSTIVVSYLWALPADDGGHGSPLWAGLLALTMVALPAASIAGEKILPLFVAFIAGIWGVMSVIIFVMVVFMGGGEH